MVKLTKEQRDKLVKFISTHEKGISLRDIMALTDRELCKLQDNIVYKLEGQAGMHEYDDRKRPRREFSNEDNPFSQKFIKFSEEEFAGSIGIKEFLKRLGIAFKALVKAAVRNEVEKVVDLSEGVTLRCSYKNGKYKYIFTDEKGREKTFEDHIPQDFNFVEWARGIPSRGSSFSESEEATFPSMNKEDHPFIKLCEHLNIKCSKDIGKLLKSAIRVKKGGSKVGIDRIRKLPTLYYDYYNKFSTSLDKKELQKVIDEWNSLTKDKFSVREIDEYLSEEEFADNKSPFSKKGRKGLGKSIDEVNEDIKSYTKDLQFRRKDKVTLNVYNGTNLMETFTLDCTDDKRDDYAKNKGYTKIGNLYSKKINNITFELI